MINFSSIKTWLYGVLVIVVIPPAVMLFDFTYERNANALVEMHERVASLARTQAGIAGELIQNGHETLERMIKRPLIGALDPSKCDPILHDTKFWYSYIVNLTVVDATGQVLCNSLELPPENLPSYRARELFSHVLESKAFTVGAPVIGHTTGIWGTSLAEPIIDEGGSMIGVLTMTVDLSHLDITVPKAFSAATDVSIVDTSGNYVIRSSASAVRQDWQGRKLSDQHLLAAVLAQQAGALRLQGPDNIDRIFGFAPVPGAPWYVIVATPVAPIVASARSDTFIGVATIALVLLLSISAGAVIVRKIEKPISSIAETARAWMDGNLQARAVESGPAETQMVVKQFNQMLEQRLIAERAQQAREAQMRLVTDNVPALIVHVDAGMRLRFINPTAASWYARAPADLVGMKINDFFPRERFEELRETIETTLAGTTTRIEQRGVYPDGKERWLDYVRVPEHAEDGRVIGYFGLAIDITARKEAEEKARQNEEQLRQAQKMEAIGELTGGMAHDFNNLLAIIIGNLSLLRDVKKEDAEVEELAGEALDAAKHGAKLTRSLLAFARRQPLQSKNVDVNALITHISQLLSRMLGEDIETTLNLGTDVWPCVIDAAQLEASLVNLATNARDAMPNGGRLIVATANRRLERDYAGRQVGVTPGDYVMIEVSDSGTGIPRDKIDRIFEPFFSTKPTGRGTGLGLSMVFGFVKQSQGHITVYSEPGAGTTFRLYLPRAQQKGEVSEPDSPPVLAHGSGETVLAVEDNVALRRVVVRQLTELGYRVIEAENASTALALLERGPADVLFTDVVMPGQMNGYELAKAALARWPSMKIVLTSGFSERVLDVSDELAVNFRLLSKPYEKYELSRIIHDALTAEAAPT